MGDNARIWIGGLPEDVTDEDITKEYERYGEIKHVQIRNNKTGSGMATKSFAFVQFADTRDAADAVKKTDQQKLFGQPFVKVSWASNGGSKGKGRGGRSRSRHRSPSRRRRSPSRRRRSPTPRNRSREKDDRRDDDKRDDDKRDDDKRDDDKRDDDKREERPRSRSQRRPASSDRRSRDRSSPRRDDKSDRDRSPPRREGHYGPRPSEVQGKYRVKIEKLPEDMGWQELKSLGTGFAKSGTCTFSRTMRDQTGILEFTTESDMKRAIEELDGRRFVDGTQKCKAYEDKGRRS